MAGMVSLPLARANRHNREGSRNSVWATLYLVAFLHQVGRAPVPLDEYTGDKSYRSQRYVRRSQGIKYIAGDYWDVVAHGFQLLNRGKPSFGLAAQGEGNLTHHLIAFNKRDLKPIG